MSTFDEIEMIHRSNGGREVWKDKPDQVVWLLVPLLRRVQLLPSQAASPGESLEYGVEME